MKTFAKNLMILLTLVWSSGLASGAQNSPGFTLVKVHADWCGACKATTPIFKSLEKQMGEQLGFILFDHTNRASKRQSEALAQEKGLSGVYKNNRKTGEMLLVDNQSSEVVARFGMKDSLEEIQKSLLARIGSVH